MSEKNVEMSEKNSDISTFSSEYLVTSGNPLLHLVLGTQTSRGGHRVTHT